LKAFMLQCRMYIDLNSEKFGTPKKEILFIVSYLRGQAWEWIQPHLEDYLENVDPDDQKGTTRAILHTKRELFSEMRTSFGYGNEQMEAERALQTIRQ
jgi:hypothetical protein